MLRSILAYHGSNSKKDCQLNARTFDNSFNTVLYIDSKISNFWIGNKFETKALRI